MTYLTWNSSGETRCCFVCSIEKQSAYVVKTTFKAINNSEKTKQFHVRVVKNLKNVETPKWMKEFLLSSGVRPISSVVDIGNYIMLLTGQPIHMYDLDKLESNVLEVKDNVEEKFLALDEKRRALLTEVEQLKNTRNTVSKEIGKMKKAGENAVYEENGEIVVEDAKGAKTKEYIIKRKLMLYTYGLRVLET